MDPIKASENLNVARRRFFSAAAISIAAAELGLSASTNAQALEPKRPRIRQVGERARPSDP
jgi:hypothetical protein